MYKDKKVIVVMPAYNAAKNATQNGMTRLMAQNVVDLVIVLDVMQAKTLTERYCT